MTDHTTELAVRKQDVAPTVLTNDQLKFISATEFVPKAMRGKLPQILACVATGRALGLPDMTALRSINVIDGKASFSAELMVQLVRQRGHSITFEASGESCTVHGKRADNGDEGSFTWDLEMAKRAGLLGKANWKAYPEAMLWARAVSQLCRMLFADCFAGATYTPEEAEDVTVDELMDESPTQALEDELLEIAEQLDLREATEEALERRRGDEDFERWLQTQIESGRARLSEEVATA